jgi:tetrapyrrole methylase family protein/MazG family protein
MAATARLPLLPSLLKAVPPAERPIGSLQLLSPDAPFELSPLVPTLVYGIATPDAWQRARQVLSLTLDPDQPVLLLAEGRAAERTTVAALGAQLPDAEAMFVPAATPEVAHRSLHSLRQLVHRLRAPGGCPWDREQTHESLIKFIIEEAYEVADAIRHEGPDQLVEELGDLLLQVFLQSELAEEAGEFTLNDVAAAISRKLIRRHPHVFGDVQVDGAAEVERNWERLKVAEKGNRRSDLDGIPRSLPALMGAQEMQRKMKKAGFDWPDRIGVENKLIEELAELRTAPTPEAAADELGDVLFILARLALDLGVGAEDALRGTNHRVDRRFRYVEARLKERGVAFGDVSLDEALALWAEAKAHERAGE